MYGGGDRSAPWGSHCPPPAVIGALIGRQEGRSIEVMNSFELLAHSMDGHVVIDKEYYYTKEEQCEGGGGEGASGGLWGIWGGLQGVKGVLEGSGGALRGTSGG